MLDTIGAVLDIIDKNPGIDIIGMNLKYRKVFHIEDWQEDPIKMNQLTMLVFRQKITVVDQKYEITENGKQQLEDAKNRIKSRNRKSSFEYFIQYIFIPLVTFSALILTLVK